MMELSAVRSPRKLEMNTQEMMEFARNLAKVWYVRCFGSKVGRGHTAKGRSIRSALPHLLEALNLA